MILETMSTPETENNTETIIEMVNPEAPPMEEQSNEPTADETTTTSVTEVKDTPVIPVITTESTETSETPLNTTETKEDSADQTDNSADPSSSIDDTTATSPNNAEMSTTTTEKSESSTVTIDKSAMSSSMTTNGTSEKPSNTNKTTTKATAQLKKPETSKVSTDDQNPDTEEELKKDLGTDHYMHFLICVFCPWWLLIWIAMCARDIYRGTCCQDNEEDLST